MQARAHDLHEGILNSQVQERVFAVKSGTRQVPVVLWTPISSQRRPLVLIGHGGSHHKSSAQVRSVATPLFTRYGFAVAAIDGPVHGDRRVAFETGKVVQSQFLKLWDEGTSVESMVEDWTATLDFLSTLPEVATDQIGWYGISMGTAYGLPYLAADSRIKAAVLGMWGTGSPSSQRLLRDASGVHIPLMFQQQADDEIFTAEGQRELFAALASTEKQLAMYPGRHVTPTGAQLADAVNFLVNSLSGK